MKKNIFLLIIFFLIFTLCDVNSASYNVVLNTSGVAVRKGPGTNYELIKRLNEGASIPLADENIVPNEKGCSDGWYKVNYGTQLAYICKSYVSLKEVVEYSSEANSECEAALKELGFPQSYWEGLCTLKNAHPTWNFHPIITNLDFESVIKNESACGESYIYTTDEEMIDRTCKSAYSSTSKWHPASKKAVAKYVDPRNWFEEKTMFQFEYLKYSAALEETYPAGIKQIIKNSNFYNYHLGIGNDLATVINASGKETDVNPIFLSTRILQELGNKDTLFNLYSGVYTSETYGDTYKGYYNFYNIGVSDSCATSKGTTYCGLNAAKNRGWDSLQKAISGGSELLSSSYITKGQYTNYLQKFNVAPTNMSKLYIHQYMTNLNAPSSESKSSYFSYKSMDLLELPFDFYIPVYLNMEEEVINSASGTENLPPDEPEQTSPEQDTPVEVEEKVVVPVSTMITAAEITTEGGYINSLSMGSKIEEIISNLQAVGAEVKVTSNGKEITSGEVGTGMVVSIGNGETTEEYSIVIKGDTSGDGKINALDLLQVQKSILGTFKLENAYGKAGDTSGDNVINALDLLQIQRNILGTYTIE